MNTHNYDPDDCFTITIRRLKHKHHTQYSYILQYEGGNSQRNQNKLYLALKGEPITAIGVILYVIRKIERYIDRIVAYIKIYSHESL